MSQYFHAKLKIECATFLQHLESAAAHIVC